MSTGLENPLPLRPDKVGNRKISFRYLQNLSALKKKMDTVIYRPLSWNHSALHPLYVRSKALCISDCFPVPEGQVSH